MCDGNGKEWSFKCWINVMTILVEGLRYRNTICYIEKSIRWKFIKYKEVRGKYNDFNSTGFDVAHGGEIFEVIFLLRTWNILIGNCYVRHRFKSCVAWISVILPIPLILICSWLNCHIFLLGYCPTFWKTELMVVKESYVLIFYFLLMVLYLLTFLIKSFVIWYLSQFCYTFDFMIPFVN